MALKGNLRDFTFYQLLNLINLAHKTGALTVEPEPHNGSSNGHGAPASLFFSQGRLVHAAYQGKPARLTDILLQSGRITPEQARIVRERSRVDSDKELGLLLIHNGILNQNEIIHGVRSYLLETVYQLFTWSEGVFRFEPNRLPPEERITVPLALDKVLLEGMRRQQEWERLRAEIPNLDIPLRIAERPKTNGRNISLSRAEWSVISSINPQRTIKEIGASLGMDDFQVRRVVHSLRENGLVELVQLPRYEPLPPRTPSPGARVSRGIIMRIIEGIRRR